MTKLLLVDDDYDILKALEFFLNRNNFEVVALLEAKAVVETVLQLQPDIILMDINLSGFDGREICRKLRKEHGVTIPIVLFSAIVEYEPTIQDYGANGFIGKPFEVKSFVNKLLSYLP